MLRRVPSFSVAPMGLDAYAQPPYSPVGVSYYHPPPASPVSPSYSDAVPTHPAPATHDNSAWPSFSATVQQQPDYSYASFQHQDPYVTLTAAMRVHRSPVRCRCMTTCHRETPADQQHGLQANESNQSADVESARQLRSPSTQPDKRDKPRESDRQRATPDRHRSPDKQPRAKSARSTPSKAKQSAKQQLSASDLSSPRNNSDGSLSEQPTHRQSTSKDRTPSPFRKLQKQRQRHSSHDQHNNNNDDGDDDDNDDEEHHHRRHPWDPEQARFQGMRERGACIRILDGWEEIVSVDGNIFYFNVEDYVGQWKKPLPFLVRASRPAAIATSSFHLDAALLCRPG